MIDHIKGYAHTSSNEGQRNKHIIKVKEHKYRI